MTEGADLYRLQGLDSEGDKKRRRLAEVEAALRESEALRRARQAVENAHERVRKWALRQRDLDLEVQGLADKISRDEQRLYSGVIKNPKELEDLQAEVAALKRRRQDLEDDLLEAMIEREEAEAAQAEAQERLDQTHADWSTQQANLIGERDVLQGELAQIEQARKALLPGIDPGDLAAYESLRRRKGGMAVVPLLGGTCGGCGVAIAPSLEWQLRQGMLVNCSNCERIIVRA
jgi:predicted  nucleic acid-binding Zn-ribbon protein